MTNAAINREHICDFITQIDVLLRLHHVEVLARDLSELDPDWDRYAEMERAGMFVAHVVRDDMDQILGYAGFFMVPDFHRRGAVIAQNDVLFVHPEHRDGYLGPRIVRHCELDMKARGAARINWAARPGSTLDKMLAAMGYESLERQLSKNLKE